MSFLEETTFMEVQCEPQSFDVPQLAGVNRLANNSFTLIRISKAFEIREVEIREELKII